MNIAWTRYQAEFHSTLLKPNQKYNWIFHLDSCYMRRRPAIRPVLLLMHKSNPMWIREIALHYNLNNNLLLTKKLLSDKHGKRRGNYANVLKSEHCFVARELKQNTPIKGILWSEWRFVATSDTYAARLSISIWLWQNDTHHWLCISRLNSLEATK